MQRRIFLQGGLLACLAKRLKAATRDDAWESAAGILDAAVKGGQVAAASLHVSLGDKVFNRAFGAARSDQAMFLLGSISKPIAITALMTLYDRGRFSLEDRVRKFLPDFTGDGRDDVTLRHLLTHVSGLPDQLPENDSLRRRHAGLGEFAEQAQRTPLHFAPGTRYQYSSMAILLAAHVAERISGADILTLVDREVFNPLEMSRSAQGLGRFSIADFVPCQTEFAAPEAGGGDPQARQWDWNSPYWRRLGAPWGGTHASAPDLGRFLAEFLFARGTVVRPATARLMTSNQNPAGLRPRGLGFDLGAVAGSPGCSEETFGHTGSTGTIAWADPARQLICVVLTSLPARAVRPHPRDQAAARVSAS